ncbi:hypothetical protein PPYR_06776 [Photinus pyralis]|uniref:RNA helicase n=1 Tax=Photinus pyralis TaxID=7054 RepID=A0A5N4ANL5_PHOPY|nr:putative helicase mov-10-B.1 [Photinus pyralis]KAB0798896.1 hypothetical protein PPYR_06776 [Photinus pyralis]
MPFYERAEGIMLKYLYFLNEKKVLTDYKIKKEHARNLFMAEFKPEHNITKFPFSTMYRFMLDWGLIHYRSRRTEFIHFKEETFAYSMRYFTQSDLKVKVDSVTAQPPAASKKKNKKHECKTCQLYFLNASLLVQHESSETHLQKKSWIETHNATLTSEIAVEVVKGHGGGPETIVLRQREKHTIFLHLLNQSSDDHIILVTSHTSSSYIAIRQSHSPHLLAVNCKETVELTATFPECIFWSYKLTFYLQNVNTKTYFFVLKELIFQVQSELVDDLGPTEPYRKEIQQNIRNGEAEIVPGVPPPPTSSQYLYKIKFQQYPLPPYMVVLLDNNLTQFSNMEVIENNMLTYIKRQLAYYSNISTLDAKNYFNINQLRLYMEEYQMKIDIRSYDAKDQILHEAKGFPSHCFELFVPGLAEHRPSVLRGDSVYIRETPDSNIKYEGIVHKVTQNSCILGLSYKFAETVHVKNKKYAVSFTFNRFPIRAEHQANELVKKHEIIPLLCPSKLSANPLTVNKLVWYNAGIGTNEKQQEAIHHIVSETARPYPYLVFGPPGTGKTITLVEAILQIRKLKPEKKILVSAPTNSAADEITKRLISYSVSKMAMFRYVAPSHAYDLIDTDVKPYTNFRDEFYHPENSEILKYSIVVTTLITAFRLVNGGTPPNHFSYVFIDESGQATETETLIPIAGILSNIESKGVINGQIILAGDPKQLGPVIHSNKAKNYGFGMSMLERLMTHCAPYAKNKDTDTYDSNVLTKLVNSYRSHPAILRTSNKLFYDNELKPPPQDHHLQNVALGWSELPNKNFPVLFHSVVGKDERESNSPSFFNLQEVDVVVSYLQKLIGNRLSGMKIEQSHIGVITPYRKQVYKLKAACTKKRWDKLRIGSVEQFQGQERLIIIVSTVRSDINFAAEDIKFHLGFVQNAKRFNVAITRAKALLIVIGNPNLLQLDTYWKDFIQYCIENGSVAGTKFQLSDDVVPLQNGIPNEDIKEEDVNFSRGNV